jgi:[acyl-carrier-protein] S-malonyltransferase
MKVGFFFPGYGCQFVGMAKDFYDNHRCMQEYFEEAHQCLDKNFVKLCFASSEKELAEYENTYISLYLVGLSLAKILQEEGINPSVVAGYDVGEYTALSVAGTLSLPDSIYLLRKYAKNYTNFLENKNLKAIRIKGIEQEALQTLCTQSANGAHHAHITVVEKDDQHVLVGTKIAISVIEKELKKNKLLEISETHLGGGLHTSFVDEVLKNIKMYLEKVDFKNAKIPFVAGVTGQVLTEGDRVRAAVMQQIHAPLNLKKTLDAYQFCDAIIIVGPGKKFQTFLKEVYPDKHILKVVTLQDMHDVLTALGKKDTKTGEHVDDSETNPTPQSPKECE